VVSETDPYGRILGFLDRGTVLLITFIKYAQQDAEPQNRISSFPLLDGTSAVLTADSLFF
jgi:hypothetical protein